jgi:arylesterase/paraoxonase
MLERSLHVYERDRESGALKPVKTLDLNTAPDNLRFDDRGRLLIGTHPSLLALNALSKDPSRNRAPAQLIAVSGLPDAPRIEELLSHDGSRFSAVSVGALRGTDLVMGTIYDDGLIRCQLP